MGQYKSAASAAIGRRLGTWIGVGADADVARHSARRLLDDARTKQGKLRQLQDYRKTILEPHYREDMGMGRQQGAQAAKADVELDTEMLTKQRNAALRNALRHGATGYGRPAATATGAGLTASTLTVPTQPIAE